MAVLVVPSSLRRYTDQRSRLTLPANTIQEVLELFAKGSSDLRNHLFSGAGLRKFVVVCKNGCDIRLLEGLSTELDESDEVQIVASVAGG
jgi:adenylyltransferase/sulfurtransferase